MRVKGSWIRLYMSNGYITWYSYGEYTVLDSGVTIDTRVENETEIFKRAYKAIYMYIFEGGRWKHRYQKEFKDKEKEEFSWLLTVIGNSAFRSETGKRVSDDLKKLGLWDFVLKYLQ